MLTRCLAFPSTIGLELEDRANVEPLPENHHLFTTRLTAKFLQSFRGSINA
jgi:hypothetical protein